MRITMRMLFAISTITLCAATASLPAHAESTFDREIHLLAEKLDLIGGGGKTAADIGAGAGEYAIGLAGVVGEGGRVIATELEAEDRAEIEENAKEAGAARVVVATAGISETGLSHACCDGVFLRGVYHHLTDPGAFDLSLFQSVKPGGRLVIIDFPPSFWLAFSAPDNVPENRGGHGIVSDLVIAELETAGFKHLETIVKWPSYNFVTKQYAVVFERPLN